MFKKSLLKVTILISIIIQGIYADVSDIVEIHGFVSQGYMITRQNNYLGKDTKGGSWQFREAGINFQKEIGARLRLGLQLFSRDVGSFGNNKIILDWAYGDFYVNDALSIAAGRVKVPTGFYAQVQDYDFIKPWVILPSGGLYDAGLRVLASAYDGIQLKGNLDLKNAGSIDYTLTGGSVSATLDNDYKPYVQQYGYSPTGDLDNDVILNGHLIYNLPIDGLRLSGTIIGIINYNQPLDGFTKEGNILWYTAGIQYSNTIFEITAELMGGLDTADILIGDEVFASSKVDWQNPYIGFIIRPTNWFSFGGYFNAVWNDIDDRDGKKYEAYGLGSAYEQYRYEEALTVGFNITPNFILKLEAHNVVGTAGVASNINPEGSEKNWQYGVAKLSYNF